MTKRVARRQLRALRALFTAVLALAIAILGLPIGSASADTSTTLGTAVLKIGSQITLTTSNSTPSPNATVTLTATFALVAGNTDIAPTGDVTFLDNGAALGIGTLSGQTASWTGRLAPGAQSLTASYGGDADYASGVSGVLPVTVGIAPVLSIALPGGNGSWLPSDASWSDPIAVTATSDSSDSDRAHTRFTVAFSGIPGMTSADLRVQEATGGSWTDVELSSQPSGLLTAAVGEDSDLAPGGSTAVNLRLSAAASAQPGTLEMAASLLGSPDGTTWSDVLATTSQQFTVSSPLVATSTTVSASNYTVVTDARNSVVSLTAAVSAPPDAGTVSGSVTFLDNGTPLSVAKLTGGSATVAPNLPLGAHAISATYSGDTTHATSTGTSLQQITVTPPGGSLHPITPVRILDTRYANGAPKAKVAARSELVLQVTGRGGIPAAGVEGISVNITVVTPAAKGVVTIYPYGGQVVPATANVDFNAGATTAGLVVTNVDGAGRVAIYNKSSGPVDLIADVSAWFAQPLGSIDTAGRYNPIVPFRLLDTRKTQRMKNASTVAIQVAGVGAIPKTGVSTVMLNVTSVNPSAPGYLVLYPDGGSLPLVSTNAFQRLETRAGRVIVGLGKNGKVDLYNSPWANTDVVVDIAGWFTSDTSSSGGSTFVPLEVSQRLTPVQTGGSLWGSSTFKSVQIAGVDGIPKQSATIHATAIVSNLHVSSPSWGGYLTAYPLAARPVTSDLNFIKNSALQNISIATLGSTGAFNLYNYHGTASITIDVYGYFA